MFEDAETLISAQAELYRDGSASVDWVNRQIIHWLEETTPIVNDRVIHFQCVPCSVGTKDSFIANAAGVQLFAACPIFPDRAMSQVDAGVLEHRLGKVERWEHQREITGDCNVITQRIQESFNKADAADIQTELKETLKELAEAVAEMNKELPKGQASEAADDFEKLVEEATKSKPNKKWYSVSIEGLIQAAENLDAMGEPVIRLSRKVLSLLTRGVVK